MTLPLLAANGSWRGAAPVAIRMRSAVTTWSAPSPVIERGRRRTAVGLLLILGVERLLREGRLRGDQGRF